jgi:hypothetical protein
MSMSVLKTHRYYPVALREAAATVAYEYTPMTPDQQARMVERITHALLYAYEAGYGAAMPKEQP